MDIPGLFPQIHLEFSWAKRKPGTFTDPRIPSPYKIIHIE